ncbi:hypothetical protein ACJJTC_018760 [Scirpophaga incertulas]
MGKRKRNKDSDHYIRKKIRKLEKKLHKRRSSSESDDCSERSRSSSPIRFNNSDPSESDVENSLRSVVTVAQVHDLSPGLGTQTTPNVNSSIEATEPLTTPLSSDLINILGDSKVKEVPMGPRILEEVSKRWGKILIDGLDRSHKKEPLSTILIPENFQLLKAPLLNQEISSVMTESTRNRDKRLERAQNNLGVGIAGLTALISNLMEAKHIDNLDLIKKLSEVGQLLLDLHYENTVNRRMLITPTLDKKFLSMTQDVKRDSYLFGENLGDKIKASKAAEKSGLQIRNNRNIGPQASGSKKYVPQGNWRGPPRQQSQQAVRQGGNKQRTSNHAPKRTPQAPTTSHYYGPPTARPAYKSTRK